VRAKKEIVGGSTTYYIGDHYEISGGVTTKYIFAGNLRIAQIKGSVVSYFHKDHLGSSTVLTDSNGNPIDSTEYMPFGGQREPGISASDYKFTDQEFDGESSLYNYNARLYDPIIGRFISADPIVPQPFDPQSLNRYSYVLNSPLIYVDPSGYQEVLYDPNNDLDKMTLPLLMTVYEKRWHEFSLKEYMNWITAAYGNPEAGSQYSAAVDRMLRTMMVIWNETASLYPALKDPNGPQGAQNHDPGSVKELREAERRVAGVAYETPMRCSKEKRTPNFGMRLHRRVWSRIVSALRTKIAPDDINHFFIYRSSDGKLPLDDEYAKDEFHRWPYTHNDQISHVYGPFRHKIDSTWFHDYYVFFWKGPIL